MNKVKVMQLAKRIPEALLEEIRQRTNIVDVIGQYVQLKKSGKNYTGLCPFHDEKTPSFSVAEDKQMYHCFGCGEGGTVFRFIQEIEGVSFPEAVAKVADFSHVPIDQTYLDFESSTSNQAQPLDQKLIDLHEDAKDIFHHILLNTKAGEEALAYLYDRGLNQEIIETFQIGYAPPQRVLLEQYFKNKKANDELLDATGLLVKRESGERLDRFYQRIMFPIQNEKGQTIAFSGRFFPNENDDGKEQPKYLNSPETSIFNKRETLFNFNRARPKIRKLNEVILFEGFMDVIKAWMADVQNGVASMGTSLTQEQIHLLTRSTKEVVICYDGDTAGIEATYRAAAILEDTPFEIEIVSLPERLDPDEYINKYGFQQFREIIHHGRESVFSFKKHYYKLERNLQNETEKLKYIDDVLTALLDVHSAVERELYLSQLSSEFQISVASLSQQFEEMRRARRDYQKQQSHFHKQREPRPEEVIPLTQQKKKLSQVDKAEQILLYRMMTDPAVIGRVKDDPGFTFASDEAQLLYVLIEDYLSRKKSFDAADFLDYLKDAPLQQRASEILYMDISDETTPDELRDCMRVIRDSFVKDVLGKKRLAQLEASRLGNKELELQLAIEIVQLRKQLEK